ncbi:MAG: T9SS type A sorting domain-containing protein [Bacteroidia bacterium]
MKKTVCILACISLISLKAQQVLNPGFENWTGAFAQNWGSVSQGLVNNGKANPNLEVRTSTAHSGSYGILLQNQALLIAGGNNVPGTICNCPIVYSGGPVIGWTPYTGTPVSYDFWYEFNAPNGDNALTRVYFTKWNTSTNKRDTLGSGSGTIPGPVSSYTQMTVPISWMVTGQNPDSMQLSFTSTTKPFGSVPAGGQLFIDDVNLNFATTSITENKNAVEFKLFPNPASTSVTCNLPAEIDHGVFCIYDENGKSVYTAIITKKGIVADVTKFAKGVYIAEINCGGGNILRKKFVVE